MHKYRYIYHPCTLNQRPLSLSKTTSASLVTIVHLIKLLDPSIRSQHVLGVPSCLKAVFKGSKCCFWQDHRRQMQSFPFSSRETIFPTKIHGIFKDGVQGKKWHTPWKFNIPPEELPSQKESTLTTMIFSGAMLNFKGVSMVEKQKTSNWVFLFGRALMPLFTRECKHNKTQGLAVSPKSKEVAGGMPDPQWLRWRKFAGYMWKTEDFAQLPHSWLLGPASRSCLFSLILKLPSYPGYNTPNNSCMGI